MQMCAFQQFLSVDPSLGRVDSSLFSDQTLMEMLVYGFDDETKKLYQDSEGMYLDICEWSCITCGDDERVIEIYIDSGNISGSLDLRYVLPKVKVLKIGSSGRRGKLTGSIDLSQLPEDMEVMRLNENQLTGEIDLTHLPSGMRTLFLQNNNLTGEIDLTQLPERMRCLYLGYNQLTGEIDLTLLPDEMKYLFLQINQLTGSLVIQRVPPRMKIIDLRRNRLNDIGVVDSQVHANIKLEESGVTSVVDENGKEVDMKRFLK